MRYSDFDEIKQIGSGGYGTVYTAKYKLYSEVRYMEETVVLKRFKSFDGMSELFISEVRIIGILIKVILIFNLTLYLFLFNSSEITPSV